MPWRTIWAVIGAVALSYVAYRTVAALAHVLTLLVVAGFFAIVLSPAVDAVMRRAHLRRGWATGVVFVIGLGLIAGMLYAFIRPLATEGSTFAQDLPGYVEDARNGDGPIGEESGVDPADPDEASEQESRADQQQHRHRHLAGDQDPAAEPGA